MKNQLILRVSIVTLIVLILFLILSITSCSTEHHLSKSQKHIDIAKRKGAVITPDTVWHHTYDKEMVYDSTKNVYIEKVIIKDSFPYMVTNTVHSGMTRQERKALEAEFKHLEKIMKLQNDSLAKQLTALSKINKHNNKTERVIIRQQSKPWMWIAIACMSLVVLAVVIVINKFIKR